MTSADLVARLEAEAEKLLHPGSRPHPVEWLAGPNGRRFIGVSSLVKNTAGDYAKRIIVAVEEDDPTRGWWGEQGNALADHHLKQITPYRENQVRIILSAKCLDHPDQPVLPRYAQLDDKPGEKWDHQHDGVVCNGKTVGWDMVGHVDGVSLADVSEIGIEDDDTDFRLVMREMKHQDPDDGEPGGNVDRATRQVLTYSAMAQRMFDVGACSLLPSDLMGEGCRLAPCAPVWGIVLHFWGRTGPCERPIRAHEVAPWERERWLDFYQRKAAAVIRSVETYWQLVEDANKDSGIDLLDMAPEEAATYRAKFLKAALSVEGGAYEWDDSPDGVQEFKRTVTAIQAGLPTGPFRELVLEVVNAKKSRDQWDVLARDREAQAVALMTQRGERSIMVTEDDGEAEVGKVTIVGGNGRASFLKWTPRTAKKAAAKANDLAEVA